MTRLRGLVPLLVTVLLGSALQAQPFLVEDIWDESVDARWDFPEFAEMGGIAYLAAQDGTHGTELWRSDGTEAGTWLVKDLCAGFCSAGAGMAVAGGALFFGANDGFHGSALWKSDGTAAGTVLVREVGVHDMIGDLNGVLLFVGPSTEGSAELWRSDGTRAGTIPLGVAAVNPIPLGHAGSLLLFSAEDPDHGRELWKTDGTAGGTSLVEDLTPGPAGSFPHHRPFYRTFYPSIGTRLFFPSAAGRLWVSDGTPAGTFQVANVPLQIAQGEVYYLAALGSEVYFSGSDADHGAELWKSDGTEAGTIRVKDLNPGTESSSPGEFAAVGGILYFRGHSTTSDSDLWKSDGTEAGTLPVEPGAILGFSEDFNALMALDDGVVFFASNGTQGREPWYSDGTPTGTRQLADAHPGSPSSFGNFSFPLTRLDGGVVASGQWFFRALTPDGWTLWKSDGTPAGTQLVKRIDDSQASGLPSSPEMIDLDGTLLFPADDGSTGQELWRSDGTEPGTSLVTDLNPGAQWSSPAHLTAFGGSIYFSASGLRRTDGTEAGTELVDGDFRGELVVAGPGLYYVCANGFADSLCRADGPFIQTIWGFSTGSIASQLTPAGSNLFFNGLEGGDEELWKTGGMPGDAAKIDIFPGSGSSQPRSITAFGDSVFLSADDGSMGWELWISDGTTAGTRRVRDIRPGAGSSDPRSIVAAGGLVFFVADDGVNGAELWRSDGTAAGTFLVKDIHPGPRTSWIRGLTALGDRVVFAADDGVNGAELWSSDGTVAGTSMVEDIRPGAGSSFPGAFRVTGHVILLAADDGAHGLELWRTDGTATGTFLVQDISPGPEPSSPAGFTLSGDYLYFTANDATHGFELWALDRAVLGSSLSAAKRVVTPAFPGSTVTFEIVITNTGAGPHPDNPGDEMVDVLPAPLALTGAFTDVGAVSVDLGENRVAWNGALAPGESATVTIEATVPASTEFQTFSNQATLAFDADGDGTNESAGVSDDPGRDGSGQATPVVVSPPPLDFHTLTPCRVLDTRGTAPLVSGAPLTLAVTGVCGIPATARAVAANLTVVGPTAPGYLTLHPAGIPAPATANVTFATGQVRSNNLQLGLLGGEAEALAFVGGGGMVHLVLDVSGYYE